MADLLEEELGAKPAPSLWDLYPELHLAIGDFSVAIHYGTAIMDRKYHKPELPYLYRGACYGLLGNDDAAGADYRKAVEVEMLRWWGTTLKVNAFNKAYQQKRIRIRK